MELGNVVVGGVYKLHFECHLLVGEVEVQLEEDVRVVFIHTQGQEGWRVFEGLKKFKFRMERKQINSRQSDRQQIHPDECTTCATLVSTSFGLPWLAR